MTSAQSTTLPAASMRVPHGASWRAWSWSLLVAPAAFLSLLLLIDRQPDLDPAWQVTTAWRSLQPSRDPPPHDAPRERVAIPHAERQAGDALKTAWYRLEPTPAQLASPPLTVFSPQPDANLALYIDGVAVGDGGRLDFPPAFHEFPLVLPIPEGLLKPGSDIEIYAVRDGRYAGLMPLYLGPAEPLQRAADYLWWMRAGVVRIALMVAFSLVLLSTSFFLLRREDTAYGWFALSTLFWIMHIGYDHIVAIPVARVLWLASTNVSLGAFVYCAIVFVHRFVGIAARRTEIAMGAVLVVFAVAMHAAALLDGWRSHMYLVRMWVPLVLLAGAYLVARLAQAAWRRPTTERHALLAAAASTLVIGVRDYLYDSHVWPAGSVFYLGYALILVVIVFGAIVVRRFAHAVGESEALSRDLEQRVAQQSRVLEAEYTRLRELESDEAQRRERERLMREMHEGIGGQLAQGLALAGQEGSRERLRGLLEDCLVDLRLMVDAVDVGDHDGDVLNLLARFRHRIGRRLEALDVELEWQVGDVPARAFGTADSLHVLRILQEAFAAALRKGLVRRLAVVTGVDANGVGWIEVRADAGASPPLGLVDMQVRAAQFGGRLGVAYGAGGMVVRLDLPPPLSHPETGD